MAMTGNTRTVPTEAVDVRTDLWVLVIFRISLELILSLLVLGALFFFLDIEKKKNQFSIFLLA